MGANWTHLLGEIVVIILASVITFIITRKLAKKSDEEKERSERIEKRINLIIAFQRVCFEGLEQLGVNGRAKKKHDDLIEQITKD